MAIKACGSAATQASGHVIIPVKDNITLVNSRIFMAQSSEQIFYYFHKQLP